MIHTYYTNTFARNFAEHACWILEREKLALGPFPLDDLKGLSPTTEGQMGLLVYLGFTYSILKPKKTVPPLFVKTRC